MQQLARMAQIHGALLLPHARALCTEYARLSAEVDALHGLQSGHIRIGTFSSVATHWLPYILRAFSHDYPGIDYELLLGDYCEVEDWLASGRVDCGFVRLPTRPEFTTIFLQRDDLAAVLPADHPLAAGETCSVQALGTEPFILLDKAGNHEVAEALARCGVTRTCALRREKITPSWPWSSAGWASACCRS